MDGGDTVVDGEVPPMVRKVGEEVYGARRGSASTRA
jgi:hypothetical protein